MELHAETYKEYVSRLHKLKLPTLGEGAFGKVFQHPEFSNVAVKVVRSDDAYLRLAKFAMENPGNRWLPKVASFRHVDFDDSTDGYVVFTEKLEPIGFSEFNSFLIQLEGLCKHRVGASGDELFSLKEWKSIADSAPSDLATVIKWLYTCGLGMDLHAHNFMKRGKQIVFNDPVCNESYS